MGVGNRELRLSEGDRGSNICVCTHVCGHIDLFRHGYQYTIEWEISEGPIFTVNHSRVIIKPVK